MLQVEASCCLEILSAFPHRVQARHDVQQVYVHLKKVTFDFFFKRNEKCCLVFQNELHESSR